MERDDSSEPKQVFLIPTEVVQKKEGSFVKADLITNIADDEEVKQHLSTVLGTDFRFEAEANSESSSTSVGYSRRFSDRMDEIIRKSKSSGAKPENN